MTRRIVVFTDPVSGKRYMTPEFNGDKTEFAMHKGSLDSCDMDWAEIYDTCFKDVSSLQEFASASIAAQKHYKSFLGEELIEIEEAPDDITQNLAAVLLNMSKEEFCSRILLEESDTLVGFLGFDHLTNQKRKDEAAVPMNIPFDLPAVISERYDKAADTTINEFIHRYNREESGL